MRGDLKNSLSKFYICTFLLISVCVFVGCSLWQEEVVIAADILSVHHFSTVGLAEMMNQVIYLWELNLVFPMWLSLCTHCWVE